MIWTIASLLIIWILSMILAFVGGRYSVREEIKEAEAEKPKNSDPVHFVQNTYAPPGVAENVKLKVEGLERRITTLEDIPLPSRGPAGPSFLEAHLDDYNMTGKEWIAHVMGRLSRVERKAGMSV